MDIIEAQKAIYDFQSKRAAELDAKLTPNLVFLHLAEEVGEIARQLVNKKVPKFRDYDESNLKEEITQLLLDVLLLSKLFDIDLEKAINNKIEEMKKRQLK